MKQLRSLVLLSCLLAGLAPTSAGAEAFPRPPELEPAISFWKEVFARWDGDHVVYHDSRDLARIYEIRRLPPETGSARSERAREDIRRAWKESLQEALEELADPATDYDALSGRSLRLFRIWDSSRNPEVYRRAAENLRSQRGIRTRFLGGVERSSRYLDRFRDIFREEGIPERLVLLPHVESSFQWNARSHAGAAGMWQFMRGTARRYMTVDLAVDERLDPFLAARAAARYLANAHERLGAWPLALTAYNYGTDGLAQAVRATGTNDIVRLVEEYEGPLFGFAVGNFYPEFLAVCDLSDSLFSRPGNLTLHPSAEFDTFPLPAYVRLPHLSRALGVDADTLHDLNPAFTRHVRSADLYLPKGYELRVPAGTGFTAPRLFGALPPEHRPATAPLRTYRVQSGDTLSLIASRHRTSVKTIQRLNSIRNPNRLRAGTVLKLPH